MAAPGTGAYESGGNLDTLAAFFNKLTVFAPGELRVAEEPSQLFSDGFDAGLDTTYKWSSPSSGGGGVAATNIQTYTALGTGTTANGWSYLQSQMMFPPRNPGWLLVTMGINMPYPYVANSYFFLGLGTSPTTPTAAAPLTDAAGFEIAIGGKMYAVCYAGGVRNVIADLSSSGNSKQPLDANVHIYYLFYKGDTIYWAIDSKDNVVASTSTGAPGPNTNILPLKLSAIAGTSAPASSALLTCSTVYVSDTARNNFQLSDGTYPWRKALIDFLGGLRLAGCSSTAIAAGAAGPTVIKSTPGTLYGALLTTGSVAGIPTAYDNASAASGKIVLLGVTNAAVGTQYNTPAMGVNCLNGITFLGGATMPAMTVFWS